jgi:starch phosphorylase
VEFLTVSFSSKNKIMSTEIEQIGSRNKPEEMKQTILENLYYLQAKSTELATMNDWYIAVAYTVRNRMMKNWVRILERLHDKDLKIVGYLSAEFLMGPHLGMHLSTLIFLMKQKMQWNNLDSILMLSCNERKSRVLVMAVSEDWLHVFLDSLTTLKVPAIGYGIRYEFGIFDQQIRDGWQIETTDKWLQPGNPWEIKRPEISFNVKFGGHTESYTDKEGRYKANWIPAYEVKGIAYDTPVPGYKNAAINLLRLWKSEEVESFDYTAFNQGDYYGAVDEKIFSETISKILYPNDEPERGKKLRLAQQYFFCFVFFAGCFAAAAFARTYDRRAAFSVCNCS